MSFVLFCFDASCFLLPLLSKKQKGNKLFIPEKKDTEVLFLNNAILVLFFFFFQKDYSMSEFDFFPHGFYSALYYRFVFFHIRNIKISIHIKIY